MGRTEPPCLYKGALYLYLFLDFWATYVLLGAFSTVIYNSCLRGAVSNVIFLSPLNEYQKTIGMCKITKSSPKLDYSLPHLVCCLAVTCLDNATAPPLGGGLCLEWLHSVV
jgi:hypothetical protein